jgi:hypothetical protein
MSELKKSLKIEPALTQALLMDIEAGGAKDALPLLAFTLERLYVEYGGDGDLRLSEYEQLGRVKGSIEAAVERALAAADADPIIPNDRATRVALLRRGLIPWLAGIDPETGSPRRRVARLSEIPEEARTLVNLLVEQRLLATDVAAATGEITVEPAHEALLRQWGLLQTWLIEDSEALMTLESVKRAARDWEANGKDGLLAHPSRRAAGGRGAAAPAARSRRAVGTSRLDLSRRLPHPEGRGEGARGAAKETRALAQSHHRLWLAYGVRRRLSTQLVFLPTMARGASHPITVLG